MLVVLAPCSKDWQLAVKMLEWWAELGGTEKHSLLLGLAPDVPREPLLNAGIKAFASFKSFNLPDNIKSAWTDSANPTSAEGPNTTFQACCTEIYYVHRVRWLWIEPDCTPMTRSCLDDIDAEDKRANKAFMGALVPNPAPHMSGVGVYPVDIYSLASNIFKSVTHAWDMVAAEQIAQNVHYTQLIQHIWWKPTYPADTGKLDPMAVLNHQCKDGSLIAMLRENRGTQRVEVTAPTPDFDAAPAVDSSPAKTVFTYFEPVLQLPQADELKLLKLWRKNWESHGWETQVLDETVAQQHPRYEEFKAKVESYNSINPQGYDRACHFRHLAMSQVGGGFLSDYDVLLVGDISIPASELCFLSGNSTDPFIPCLFYATKTGFDFLVQHLISTTPTEPHWSDMVAFRSLK